MITWFRRLADELKTFAVLFKRESVFRYFTVIVLLAVVSATLFAVLEQDRVLAANPGKGVMSPFDKAVTVFYWAIVTISTTGYGDISPGTNAGRLMAVVAILLSIASVSLLSANLASALTTKKLIERLKGKGIAMLRQQKNLFVICGWKRNMDDLIKKILSLNPTLKTEDMVIIADISEEEISRFKAEPELSKVNFVQGEYFNTSVLTDVNLKDSRKVMVMADMQGNETEVDFRTIMAVISIKSLAPTAYVCAEVLNGQYENYLKMAMCDEMIFIKDYSRTLIANASYSTGIAHIIQNLLDPSTDTVLVTESVPDAFKGKTYGEYRRKINDTSSDTLLGILENTGTLFEMKRHAVREAQKIADMTKLVGTLQGMKKIECNKPVLNPPDDFVIPHNCMGIFIRRTEAIS
jgi:voltage-gated potassium channel